VEAGTWENTVAYLSAQDRTGFFTVVGAPSVAEQHDDTRSHYRRYADEGRNGVLMASLWLAFYAVIIGVTVLGKVGSGRAVEIATAFTQ
jgi:hypothetical protein